MVSASLSIITKTSLLTLWSIDITKSTRAFTRELQGGQDLVVGFNVVVERIRK